MGRARNARREGATWRGPAGLRQRLCMPPSSSCTERAGTELSAGQVQMESMRLHSDGEDRLRSFLGRGLYLWPAISERTGPRRQPGPLGSSWENMGLKPHSLWDWTIPCYSISLAHINNKQGNCKVGPSKTQVYSHHRKPLT